MSSPSSGTHELTGGSFTTSLQRQLSMPGDVTSAHQYFNAGAQNAIGTPVDLTGMAGTGVGVAPTGLESVAMGGAVPGADAAIAGVIAGANEPISPIIQMIMRMPGAMGLMNSFFEFFSNFFFSQTSIFDLLNPSFLAGHAATAISHTIGEMPINLALLPGNAPFFQTMNSLGQPFLSSDLLSAKLNLSLGDNSLSTSSSFSPQMQLRAPFDVAGRVDPLGKPLYEGAANTQGGLLSGPALSDLQAHSGGQLAGNTRLFSDKIAGAGFRNISQSATSASGNTPAISNNVIQSLTGPSTTGNAANVTFEPAGFKLDTPTVGQGPELGPSGAVSDQLGGKQLLAMEQPSSAFSPSIGAGNGPAADLGQTTGLKAKQLSLESVKGTPDSSSVAGDGAGSQVAAEARPQPAHHAQSAPAKPAAAHKPAHHGSHAHKPAAHRSHGSSHRVSKPSRVAKADGEMLAQSSGDYTIESGDCLWNIARDHLGDATRWTEIYQMNQELLGTNPDLIYPGTTIQMPGSTDIASAGSGDLASAGVHVVQPGDNLWNLSRDYLGEGHKWGDIYNANQQIVGSNPDLIYPGQELTIPGQGDAGSMISSNTQPLAQTTNTAPQTGAESLADSQPIESAPSGTELRTDTPDASQIRSSNDAPNFYEQQPDPVQPVVETASANLEMSSHAAFSPTLGAPTQPVQAQALPVIPANSQPIAAGPGAAHAASNNAGGVVSTGILGDLQSFLGKKTN